MEAREKAKNSLLEVWRDEEKAKELLRKMYRTRNRKVVCKKGQIEVKSSYEERMIHLLDELCLRWEYEPKTFSLPEMKKNYIPDFYIEELDIYVEVKGYWYKDAKEKWDSWIKTYPDIKRILVNKETLTKLENGEKLENFIYQEDRQN
jgi:predicted nuclease of restriction endonuclease-like RecB superfamily